MNRQCPSPLTKKDEYMVSASDGRTWLRLRRNRATACLDWESGREGAEFCVSFPLLSSSSLDSTTFCRRRGVDFRPAVWAALKLSVPVQVLGLKVRLSFRFGAFCFPCGMGLDLRAALLRLGSQNPSALKPANQASMAGFDCSWYRC